MSRIRPTSQRAAREIDFIDPITRGPNFGDKSHSYWGAQQYKKSFGSLPPMKDGVFEVILERPLGIVFEEVPIVVRLLFVLVDV